MTTETEKVVELIKSLREFIGDKTYAVHAVDYVPSGSVLMSVNALKVKPTDPDVLLFCARDYKECIETAARLAQSQRLYVGAEVGEQIVSFP